VPHRNRLARGTAVLVALALILAPTVASGNDVRDPDDVSGKLDFKRLSATKRHRIDNAIATMTFHDGFRPQALKKPNALFLWIDVNVDGDADFKGTIRSTRSGILMEIDDLGGRDPFNPLPVFRLAHDTYRVVLPSRQPYNTRGRKAFYATSKYCSTTCVTDRVPDAGWVGT
jgi:hypothetical protein